VLQEFKNYEICSSKQSKETRDNMETIDKKTEAFSLKSIKSILCGSVKSLGKIFANFTKKFEEGDFFARIRNKIFGLKNNINH
jgi:hypothetical protein